MPVGARSSPKTPTGIARQAEVLTSLAESSPQIAADLEDLARDSLEAMRATLEHGTAEERIAVFKAMSPVIVKMSQRGDDSGSTELDAAAKARAMLMGAWEDLG